MASGRDITNKIRKAINDAIREMQSPRQMQKIGDEAATIIRRRTLLGYGVAVSGGPRQALKRLADSYVSARRRQAGLSTKTTPQKSNLTRFGFLLDSLVARVRRLGEVEIKPDGTRPDGLTNEKVAEYVSEDRPFLNLSDNEIKQLEISANIEFESIVKKNLTKL